MKKVSTLFVQFIVFPFVVFFLFFTPPCAWAKGIPRSFVMIADSIEERVFFYSVPKLRFLGELPIALGSSSGSPPHAGTIGLLDGRAS